MGAGCYPERNRPGPTLFAALSLALCLLAAPDRLRPSTRGRQAGGWRRLYAGLALGDVFRAVQVGGVAAGLLELCCFSAAAVVALDSPGTAALASWRDAGDGGSLVGVGLVLVTPLSAEAPPCREGVLWGVLSALLFAVLALLNRHQRQR